jgi:hypothetical protein
MKKNRFLWLFLFLLLAANAGVYFPSCQRDAEQLTVKPLSDKPVSFRDCDNPSYCTATVTMDVDIVVDLCGDMPQVMTTCTACGSSSKTGISSVTFLENEPRQFCVDLSGEFCISNPITSSTTIGVTVQFGTSTPVNTTISPGQTVCFNTNIDCSVTSSGCN